MPRPDSLGLTPDMTCLIVPSLPAASIACGARSRASTCRSPRASSCAAGEFVDELSEVLFRRTSYAFRRACPCPGNPASPTPRAWCCARRGQADSPGLTLHFGQDFPVEFMSTSPSVKHLVRPRPPACASHHSQRRRPPVPRHVVSVAGDRFAAYGQHHKVVEDGFVRAGVDVGVKRASRRRAPRTTHSAATSAARHVVAVAGGSPWRKGTRWCRGYTGSSGLVSTSVWKGSDACRHCGHIACRAS